MQSLKTNLLYTSLDYWTRSKIATQHPLDFYCSVVKPSWSDSHQHPSQFIKEIALSYFVQWPRDVNDFNLQSLLWSLSKFDFLTVRKVIDMKDGSHALPIDVVTKLTMSLASLEAALLEKDPMMPQHLRASHQLLISYPETVHLLDDDEIARLINAAQIHSNIEIVKANAAKGGSRKKITADDL